MFRNGYRDIIRMGAVPAAFSDCHATWKHNADTAVSFFKSTLEKSPSLLFVLHGGPAFIINRRLPVCGPTCRVSHGSYVWPYLSRHARLLCVALSVAFLLKGACLSHMCAAVPVCDMTS